MKNTNQETKSVYLFPQKDHKYGAAVSAGTPPMEGAVKLTDIKEYPVDVFYSRTDLNGSLCYEMDHCQDESELLSSLDWCGRCRYRIHQVWDFDLRETKNTALLNLLHDAAQHRYALIEKEIEKFAEAQQEEQPIPLSVKIHDAQQSAASPENHGSHIPQEPTH